MIRCFLQKHIAGLIEDKSYYGRYTGNDYRKALTSYFNSLPIHVDRNAGLKNNDYKNGMQEMAITFIKNKQTEINLDENNKCNLVIDSNLKIIDNSFINNYSKALYFNPHTDDLCWSAMLLRLLADKLGYVNTKYFSLHHDHLGLSPETIVEMTKYILERQRHRYHDITADHMIAIAERFRTQELINMSNLLGITNFVPIYDPVSGCYYGNNDSFNNSKFVDFSFFSPKRIVVDQEQKRYSYLSEFNIAGSLDATINSYIISNVEYSDQKKTLVILPFIYDFHPVHQTISKRVLNFIFNLSSQERKQYDLLFYFSGDGSIGIKGNRVLPFDDYSFKNRLWGCSLTQISRQPDYPFYNAAIDRHNSCLLNINNSYSEKFLAFNMK